MDFKEVEEQFMNVNKFYASLLGTWSKQPTYQRVITFFVVYTSLLWAIGSMVARVVVFWSFNLLLEQYPFLCVGICGLLKYINCWLNKTQFRQMYEGIVCDWQKETNEECIRILQTYSKRAKNAVILYAGIVSVCGILFACFSLLSPVMDIIKPLNETRERHLVYPSYYFQFDNQYYPLRAGHTMFVMTTTIAIVISCDSNYMYFVQHACGLLNIAGHRLCHAMDNLKLVNDRRANEQEVISSIKTHKRAIQCVRQIQDIYGLSIFLQMGFILSTFTVTLVQISTIEFDVYLMILNLGFMLTQLFHVFTLTIQGQLLGDMFNEVFNLSYNACWYNGHPRTQALYILVLKNSLNHPVLSAGGIIPLNLKTFGEIIKTSVSYFTVLQSV